MDYTASYKLKKATYSDPASIIDFMGNFDTIDTLLKNINDILPNKAEHTQYVADADLNTLLDDKSYICTGTLKNAPASYNYCFLRCYATTSANRILQVCTVLQNDNTAKIFTRMVIPGGAGGAWNELAEAITNETIAEIVESEYMPGEDAVPLTNSDIDTVF